MLFFVAVYVAGVVAGFLNVMAAGGSLITLPLLIFLGLPAATANGTNRVAILVQSIAAVTSFRQQGYAETRAGLPFALMAVPGAIAGALVAVRVSDDLFRAILAGVLLLSVVGLLFPGARERDKERVSRGTYAVGVLSFLGIGFYGGFIQAGVGFLFMLVFHRLLGLDLVRTNVYKVLVVLFLSTPALVVFILTGNVVWGTALVLAAGTATGAVIATRVSVKGGERPIRIVLAMALLLMAVRLVW
ncbi:MAG: sulfite exporter TauE/SafE family protein [Gemmatimonadales bacterium]